MDVDFSKTPKASQLGPKENFVNVGANIHRLRTSHQWTLHQAAEKTGTAFSTLSKIEKGDLSPTVTTLAKIANGFQVTVSSLLEDNGTAPATGRRSISRASDGKMSSTGTCDNQWLCSGLANKKMIPIRTKVRARDLNEYTEWARYNAEIFLIVLKGKIVIHSEIYSPTELEEGDSIYYDASTGHLWVSAGDGDSEVLWTYAE
jgi:transcriptional regulator with XRE-family HTH domain